MGLLRFLFSPVACDLEFVVWNLPLRLLPVSTGIVSFFHTRTQDRGLDPMPFGKWLRRPCGAMNPRP
jgi:hypothetical protein